MENPINPFQALAGQLHSQMAATATLISEIPGFDDSSFASLHRRHLALVEEAGKLLHEAQAYHTFVVASRQVEQYSAALSDAQTTLEQARTDYFNALMSKPATNQKVAELPADQGEERQAA